MAGLAGLAGLRVGGPEFLTGLTGWLAPSRAQSTAPQMRDALPLALHARTVRTRFQGPASPETALWRFAEPAGGNDPLAPVILRVPAHRQINLNLTNALPLPIALAVRGLDRPGASTPEATASTMIAPGTNCDVSLPPLRRGTYLIQTVSGAASEQPARIPLPCAVLIADGAADGSTEPAPDAVLMIEDWRLAPHGAPLIPGMHLAGLGLPEPIYSANGRTGSSLRLPGAGALLRLVNAGMRAPFALHFADHDVRVVAIDSAPAEPFMARDSRVILSPGGRMDVEIAPRGAGQAGAPITLFDGTQRTIIAHLEPRPGDAATPIPATAKDADSLHLSKAISLTGARRVALSFGAAATGHAAPAGPFIPFDEGVNPADALKPQPASAFKARRGETISLALTSSAPFPMTLQLDGHHFRLLDALDDGWKPFWLDTLTLEAGHTARLAFVPQASGRFSLILRPLDWKAAALIAWFEVA